MAPTESTYSKKQMADAYVAGLSSSDDSESDISQNEFTTHRRKRRRKNNGKEDAALGVFGSEEEEEYGGKRSKSFRKGGLAFRGEGVGFVQAKDKEEDEDEDEEMADEDEDEEDELRAGFGFPKTGSMGAGNKDEDEDEEESRASFGFQRAGFSGVSKDHEGGSGASTPHTGLGFKPAFTPAVKTGGLGLGSGRGLGFKPAGTGNTGKPADAPLSTPLRQGFVSSSQQFQMPELTAPDRPETPPVKAKSAFGANAKKGGGMSFAERMMARMGYKEGQGLGKEGKGILAPIEVQVRPQGAGVGVVKEKTKQQRDEERRKGLIVSDSEDEKRRKRRQKKKEQQKAEGGAPAAQKKKKTKFLTTEEIENSGLEIPKVLKDIIDFTGKEAKVISSSDISTPKAEKPAPTPAEIEQAKIARMAQRDMESFGQEWQSLQERKKNNARENERLSNLLDDHTGNLRKLNDIMDAVTALQNLKIHEFAYEDAVAQVVSSLEKIQIEYQNELVSCGLTDIAIAGLIPLFKEGLEDWDPLRKPTAFVDSFRRLKSILQIQNREDIEAGFEKGGSASRPSKTSSAYESLILNLWLPKVRAYLNANWKVHEPAELISLLDAWDPVLPPFVTHKILHEIVVPRVISALEQWSPKSRKRTSAPHIWVFPWLQHLSNDQTASVLSGVKRAISSILKSHNISSQPPDGLAVWKEVLDPNVLENQFVRYLLPRLAEHLRENFTVNPADQDLEPLESVLAWAPYFRPSTFAALLAREFFPKWLATLHLWLTSEPDYSEVHEWYKFWQDIFPKELRDHPQMREQFNQALDMINMALDLGSKVTTDLPPPAPVDVPTPQPIEPSKTKEKEKKKKKERAPKIPEPEEATFRDVLESWCADHDLLLIPVRKSHPSGAPLFRISESAAGTGGVVVYIKDDVVWMKEKGKEEWKPTGLERLLSCFEGH